MNKDRKTADYQIIKDTGGNRYRFFCAISGAAVCITKPVRGRTPEEELDIAWKTEGRQCFNRCRKCGRWVSDVMYNADELQCVDCAPWKGEVTFCPYCGAKLDKDSDFCPECGAKVKGGAGNGG